MKKLFLLIAVFILSKAYAYDGVIIVLEAPLLQYPNLNSTVLQTLRKGSRVYVPKETGDLLAQSIDLPEFTQTYDRVGNLAYIPTKYIKIITNEIGENKMPITLPISDPTDYRIEEPIPSSYPFADLSFLRASLAFTMGSNIKAPYDYNSAFSKQTFSSETGARLVLTRKMNFDKYDRYYFGMVAAINTTNNTVAFQNTNSAKENRSLIKLGPIITFDIYKTEKLRFTLGSGFTYNYHKSTVTMSDALGSSEQRIFSGYSLAPFTNTMVQFTDVIPMTDFILGADFNLFLPHNQKAANQIVIPELWNADSPEQIHAGLKSQVAFFLGFQVKY